MFSKFLQAITVIWAILGLVAWGFVLGMSAVGFYLVLRALV